MMWIEYYAACLKTQGSLDFSFWVDCPYFTDGITLQHFVTQIRLNSLKRFEM